MALTPELAAVLGGKNTLPPPERLIVVPEVRTMSQYVSVPQDRVEQALAARPGVFAVVVSWHYQATDTAEMLRLLASAEPRLATAQRPGITYLGTYRKLLSELDRTPHFITQWGLTSLAAMDRIGIFDEAGLQADYDGFANMIDKPTLAQAVYSLAVLSRD